MYNLNYQEGLAANLKRIFLRTQIFDIEETQIAESIKQIGDVFMNEKGGELAVRLAAES